MCGKGFARACGLSLEEKRTFMAQRALSASPLFIGGDLTTLGAEDLALLTHPRMLACNQNGISAKPVYMRSDVQVWRVAHRTARGRGWLGVFNRNPAHKPETIVLNADRLALAPQTTLHDIWAGTEIGTLGQSPKLTLPTGGVRFIEYADAVFADRVTTTEAGN